MFLCRQAASKVSVYVRDQPLPVRSRDGDAHGKVLHCDQLVVNDVRCVSLPSQLLEIWVSSSPVCLRLSC